MSSSYRETALSESPFHGILNTNYIPTDAGIAQIHGHLALHETELARVEAFIEKLTLKRNRMKTYIDAHRALTSYPRRLPPEILQQIFVWCLPRNHNAVMDVAEAPLLLGRICSRWRSVAFSTPELWDSLHISVVFTLFNEAKIAHAAINDWLTRAAPRPLSLSIACSDLYTFSSEYERVLDCLSPFSSRWRSVEFGDIPITLFSQLGEKLNTPLLADVHLKCLFGLPIPGVRDRILSSNLFNRAKVHITSLDPAVFIVSRLQNSEYHSKWDHLTHLTFSLLPPTSDPDVRSKSLSFGTVYLLLQRCTQLQSLTVPIEASADRFTEDLVHPALESLTLFNRSLCCEALDGFVSYLELPQLTKFHLINLDVSDHSFVASVGALELLALNSPLISDLRLHLPDAYIVNSLHTILADFFPRLERLSLGLCTENSEPHVPGAHDIFRMLAPGVVPGLDLKELELGISCVWDVSWLEFLWKHIDAGSNLRRIHLELWREDCLNAPAPVEPALDPFLTRGLEVSVKRRVQPVVEMTPWEGVEK
ncbi:hypothetical protein R3P38DRAFT_3123687 [Favolaschia claudopus]|uniref:F-box domain-containing protein n=1 Tax=Favolaschia claudopus TaxID=2862362 RepID=A0AAV9ZCI8_9AGAR